MRRAVPASKSKVAHIVQITHRDEVEPPFTDWLQEAYGFSDVLAAKSAAKRAKPKSKRRAKPAAGGPAPLAAKRKR